MDIQFNSHNPFCMSNHLWGIQHSLHISLNSRKWIEEVPIESKEGSQEKKLHIFISENERWPFKVQYKFCPGF